MRPAMSAVCRWLSGLFFCLSMPVGCSQTNTENYPAATSNHKSVGYVQINQGELFFQKFGSGEAIIVLHGGPGMDHSYLLPQMLDLAKDHKVIFYDQRGSGKSLNTAVDPKHINLDRFTEDLEELRLALGLQKFTLLGHSWGGFLAMNYAIKYPNVVSSLILLSSAPADYEGQQMFIEEFTQRTSTIKNISSVFDHKSFEKLNAKQIHELYKAIFSVYFYNPKDVEYLTLKIDKASALSGMKVLGEMSKTSWITPNINLFPALEYLQVPTLIIHGNQDIIPVHTAQEIADAIPNTQAIYLDHCGHFPYIEKRKEFLLAIKSFLDRESLALVR